MLRFSKYEALGNDFLIPEDDVTPAQARALCDRHRGIGADGVLLVNGTRMRVINADGSRAQMCGNGIRCVARHLDMAEVVIDTDAGPHACFVAGEAVTVEMRVGTPFAIDGHPLNLTGVSVGNPHAVTFDDAMELGPALCRDLGVNVGFARMLNRDTLKLDVCERGVGWTQACGTGACAAAVVAVETGRAPREVPIEVQLPGGSLWITVGTEVFMTGPARHVFDGVIDLDALTSADAP